MYLPEERRSSGLQSGERERSLKYSINPVAAKKEKADTLKNTTEGANIDMIHASANLAVRGFPEKRDRSPVFSSGAPAVAAFHRICLLFFQYSLRLSGK
jgi:hypothetical protein